MIVESSRTFRSLTAWYFNATVPSGACLALFLVMVDDWLDGLGVSVFELAFLAFLLLLSWRGIMSGLRFVEGAVVYRGYLRTVRIPVEDVREIRPSVSAVPLWGNLIGDARAVELVRRDGRSVECMALYGRTRKIDPMIDEIRRELKRRRRGIG